MKQSLTCVLLTVVNIAVVTAWALAVPVVVLAQQSSSTTYSVDEVYFGTGGELDACSTSYCSRQSAGETAVGNASSSNYQIQGGQNTNREEYIEVVLNNIAECGASNSTNKDLGLLSTATRATAITYFSVKSYLASAGYVVYTSGSAPKVTSGNSYTLATPNSGVGSNPAGIEQFGINLVANTNPAVGVNPVQRPDSSFSTGQASTGYNTADSFRYVDGEIIADSNGKSSGTTCYTMSYLYNIKGATPAGEYKFSQSVVATSTY